jgi:hypothetical protein
MRAGAQATGSSRASACAFALLVGCSSQSDDPLGHARAPHASAVASASTPPTSASSAPSAPSSTTVGSADVAPTTAPPSAPLVSAERARELLFPEGPSDAASCAPDDVRCWISHRYEADPKARELALAMYVELGDVVGLETAHTMDGGFRGSIRIVPELPIGPHRKHLEAIVAAQRASASLYAELERRAGVPLPYRQRALGWRFFRSVGRTTPSAYAGGWEVGFNVSGSLHSSPQAVLETIVHEVFHLNDQAHGAWSRRVLGPISDALVARCGTRIDCLRPHAPMKTLVRGGTYYAFQPGNGDSAHEYAAELATRYFLEQRWALEGHDTPPPMPGAAPGRYKCGPAPNAEAWRLLADEFFGGVDLTGPCG